MSATQYLWDLEERAEDAIIAHIKMFLGRQAMVIASRETRKAVYPLVVVGAGPSDNKNDSAAFTGKRQFDVVVHIETEAVDEVGDDGSAGAEETARERHRAVKAQVIGALAGNTVHDELNALAWPGIQFSQCHMTTQIRDAGDRTLVTEQTLDVIAQPKEL